ncbi:enolase-phosphatase E1-like, partial [Trifolium medium]|nr:enolase-phosphatase E1-like [Trifolium medium]
KINSLANENGDKHDDKPDDSQSQATPSSKTEDEVKAELSTAEIITDDSSALELSVEDSPKPDIVDDAQNPAVE